MLKWLFKRNNIILKPVSFQIKLCKFSKRYYMMFDTCDNEILHLMTQKVPCFPVSYTIIIHFVLSMTVVKDGYLELMPLLKRMHIYVYISISQILQGCLKGQEIRAETAQDCIFSLVKQDPHLDIMCERDYHFCP